MPDTISLNKVEHKEKVMKNSVITQNAEIMYITFCLSYFNDVYT